MGYGSGGGGGGQSSAGQTATACSAGTGGAGITSSITGSSVTYGSGGGGGAATGGTAASGGTGAGAGSSTGAGASATTYGSGGGGGSSCASGGAGAQGAFIISYPGPRQWTGGTITTVGGNTVHTFTSNGTFTYGISITASYLIVGGGGGAAANNGGGGGAGGVLTGSTSLLLNTTYPITVGAGGLGSNGNPTAPNGENSTAFGLTALGGGGGGGGGSAGGNGGSGGGAGDYNTTAGLGTVGQGNNGGSAPGDASAPSAGGGGAGGVGGNATPNQGGNGGAGIVNPIAGSTIGQYSGGSYYIAGGGGGSTSTGTPGTGGLGGGGAAQVNAAGISGTPNTGGGGGGASGLSYPSGGNGGSGVVIVSYVGAQQFGGGVVTTSGGNTIHTFTASGSLTPLNQLTASYLIVAGGGGGGASEGGGGGGAGGMQTGTGLLIDANSTYAITVGAGGVGGVSYGGNGSAGANSSFSGVATASVGGGYGNGYNNTAGNNGGSGGSGGGGSGTNGVLKTGGAGTAGQGNAGGNNGAPSYGGAGGGGGAGAAGVTATSNIGGNGGAGLQSSITGTATYYAGGGGGGSGSAACLPGSSGGVGGGGAGGGSFINGTAATANTGGGGGGGGAGSTNGAAGGSGIVVVSYPGCTPQMVGGSVTVLGGNVIHTFTSSGYLEPTPYTLTNSLRFRSSASASLTRTPAVSSNLTTWTWSAWVKRGNIGVYNELFSVPGSSTNSHHIYFYSSDQIGFEFYNVTYDYYVASNGVYNDTSAWYHIVAVWDTTQPNASDRMKLYVNNTLINNIGATSYPSQNFNGYVNTVANHATGKSGYSAANYFDGEMAEINFIDGQALSPYSFGYVNQYRVWQPIRYAGSYGTNGYYLPFTNNSSVSALGYDSSGNNNNWTPNNISLTTGATYDSMTDVPTLTSATQSNYAVLNPLMNTASYPATITNSNLTTTFNSNVTNGASILSSIAVSSGKWYFEGFVNNQTVNGLTFGIAPTTFDPSFNADSYFTYYSNGYGYQANGQKVNNNSFTSYGATWTTNDIIGIAFDLDAGTIQFYKNGVSQGVAFTGIPAGTYAAAVYGYNSSVVSVNFGQQPFQYTPPAGYVALNTYNM